MELNNYKIIVVFMLCLAGILNTHAQVTVSTFAGSGTSASIDGVGISASFNSPIGITRDVSGNFYVVESDGNRIRKITPAGVVTTFAGSGDAESTDATGTAASFNYPLGIAADLSGNLYVADASNNKIRKITPAGVVTTFAGNGTEGNTNATGTAASFNYPSGVAVDASGNVYVADQFNHKIRKITPAGVVTTFAGSGVDGSADATGTAASFNYPSGVAVDASGNVYVADPSNHKIRKITSGGVVSTFAGSGANGSDDGASTIASFNSPFGLVVDNEGNVIVADAGNNKIRKITSQGVVTTLAGSGVSGSTDGQAMTASFNFPSSVTLDISGNVYVTDTENRIIRKITPGTLPLTWLSFTASASGNTQAKLQWRVEEIEVASYQAEHSIDGVNFSPVGALVSSKGNGLNSYFVTIPSANNTVYYRVYQKDQDGKGSYSSIAILESQVSALATEVYPVPFNKTLTINSTKKQQAYIINVQGQNVLKLQLQQGENVADVSALASGVYYLKEEDGSVKKLMKD